MVYLVIRRNQSALLAVVKAFAYLLAAQTYAASRNLAAQEGETFVVQSLDVEE